MTTDPNPFDLCDKLNDVACQLSALDYALTAQAASFRALSPLPASSREGAGGRDRMDDRVAGGLSMIITRQIRAIDAVVKELHPLSED